MRNLLILLLVVTTCHAQPLPVAEYIKNFRQLAMYEQVRSGVPAAITLAQGIHESAAGQGPLALKSNNHFGIKCKNTWTGGKVYHDDDASQECFRAYTTVAESYKDHSDFLRNNGRYGSLFNLDPADYQGWAKGLKQAGYATNPKYPILLIKIIEENGLNDITLLAMQPVDSNNAAIVTTANAEPGMMVKTVNTAPAENKQKAKPEPKFLEEMPAQETSIYPTSIFKINDLKVMVAASGTSLLALASKHKLSLSDLLSNNDMDNQQILEQNQLVFLEKKKKKGEHETHKVAAGETLWSISQKEGIRLSSLLEYNGLVPNDKIEPGKTLYLQGAAPGTVAKGK